MTRARELAIDATRSYSLWDREHYLEARVSDPGEADRAGQLDQLRVIEKFAARAREKQHPAMTREPEVEQRIADRREVIRLIVWQNSAKEGLDWAAGKATTTSAHVQVALMRQDLDLVKKKFRDKAYENAYKVLDESSQRIGDTLRSYGLMVAAAQDLVHDVSGGYKSTGEATTEWLERARTHAEYTSTQASGHRGDLGTAASRLRKFQETSAGLVIDYVQRYGFDKPSAVNVKAEPQRALLNKIKTAQAALNAAWIEAEKEHPVLAAWRKGRDVGGLKGAGAGSKAQDAALRDIVAASVETLGNILTAKAALKQKKVSPLELAPIVGLTRAQMVIVRGSYWDAAINDLIAEETAGSKFAKTVVQIVLAALSILPGGQIFALLGVALDLYTAGSEYVQYGLDKAFAGTDLDRAKALSDKTPSLAGFAWALVSAGLNMTAARAAFKDAEALAAKAAQGEQDAIEALNALGKERGLEHLGKDVAAGAGKARVAQRPAAVPESKPPPVPAKKPPPVPQSKPPPVPAKKPPPVPAKKPPPVPEKKAPVAEEPKPKAKTEEPKPTPARAKPPPVPGALRTMIDKIKSRITTALKGAGKGGMNAADLPEDYKLLLNLLDRHVGKRGVREMEEAVPHVMGALRNPEAYGEVLAEAYARSVANGTDLVTELKAMAQESGLTLAEVRKGAGGGLLEPGAFYREYASQPIAMLDKAAKGGDHGEMMHIIQDLIVNRALQAARRTNPGLPASSGAFRSLMGRLDINVQFPNALQEGRPLIDMPLGEAVWRGTYDLYDLAHLPTPEVVMPKLKDAMKDVMKTKDAPLW